MKRTVLQLALVVALVYAGITVLKSNGKEGAVPVEEGPETTEERARTRRFWEVYRQATDLRIAGRMEMARAAYEEALLLNPKHEDALYYQGAMARALGDFNAAAQAWERLLALNPAAARAHAQLGDLHLCYPGEAVFSPEVAGSHYQQAYDLNKEETGSLLGLGRTGLVAGDFSAARAAFTAVIGSNEGSVAAYFFLGYLDWKDGNLPSAQTRLEAAFQRTRPEAPTQAVQGEGDTRAGARPLTSEDAGCALFRSHLDLLYQGEQQGIAAFYPALDAALRSLPR